MKLITLSYNDLCDSSGIDFMYILIVLELILLILIIAKIASDVRHYNTTGELPWLARHICLGFSYSGLKSANQNTDWHPQENFADLKPLHMETESEKKQSGIFSKCLGEKL